MSKTLAIKGGSKSIINQLMGWTDCDGKANCAVEAILKTVQIDSLTDSKGMPFEPKLSKWNE